METFNKEISRIASGTRFKGDFATRSDLRIDGVFEGKLYCSGRLVVGENGVVKGTVIGNVIEFSGTMEGGSFFVKDTLSLKSGSVVEGDIFTRRFQVDLGARFIGTSKILEEEKYMKAAAPFESLLPSEAAPAAAERVQEAPVAVQEQEEPVTESVSEAEPAPAPAAPAAPAARKEEKTEVDSMAESWLGWNKKRSQ